MVNIFWLRPKVGDALWLWAALNFGANFNSQGEWFPVMEGNPISDLQLGSTLFCTEETIKEWRERLEAAGLIRCTLLNDRDVFGQECRKYEVVNLNFGAPQPGVPPMQTNPSGKIN